MAVFVTGNYAAPLQTQPEAVHDFWRFFIRVNCWPDRVDGRDKDGHDGNRRTSLSLSHQGAAASQPSIDSG